MSLIVIEGLDGSGKGTQTALLLESLQAAGERVRKVDFPNYASDSSALVKLYLNGAFGSDPAQVNPFAASTFYAVDRFAGYASDWGADYRAGVTILADRYATSNYTYQMSKLPRERWGEYLRWAEDLEYERLALPRPDRVLFLDMPLAVSQRLLTARYQGDEGKKDIHERHPDYLRRCRECALFAGERLGWTFIPCGEEDGGPYPVEEIRRRVWTDLRGESCTQSITGTENDL